MEKRNYIDLHCHPSFKSMFKNPQSRWNNWTGLTPADVHNSPILVSQSSLSQLAQSTNLVIVPFHPVEPGMIKNLLLSIADLFLKATDFQRLKKITRNDPSSNDLLIEELDNIQVDSDPSGKKIKILKKISEYNVRDTNTLHIILAVEGPHAFYDARNRTDDPDEIIKRFGKWMNHGFLVLYQSLTHMTPGIFANHAYGNKILPKKYMLPEGKGIRRPHGVSLIDKIYEKNLLVDVKHMSVVARKEFYDHHASKWSDKPIIFSHGGVTGFSWKEILDKSHIKEIDKRSNTVKIVYNKFWDPIRPQPYYPLSINLYDEEIVEIIQSKGLICLELDARILGNETNYDAKEFVSPEEFDIWVSEFSNTVNISSLRIKDNSGLKYQMTIEDSDEEFENFITLIGIKPEAVLILEERHIQSGYYERLFVNQILHIYDVVKKIPTLNGLNVWNHISIGSDFDGLIETLPTCTNASQIDQFADLLEGELDKTIKQFSLDLGEPTSSIINKIFRINALEFLKNQFP